MDRAEALRDLIARVEANYTLFPFSRADGAFPDPQERANFWDAYNGAGSIDAVARLEAPLLGPPKGWHQCVWLRSALGWKWEVSLHNPHRWGDVPKVEAIAGTEARARLLAVLKAMLHEIKEDPGYGE